MQSNAFSSTTNKSVRFYIVEQFLYFKFYDFFDTWKLSHFLFRLILIYEKRKERETIPPPPHTIQHMNGGNKNSLVTITNEN